MREAAAGEELNRAGQPRPHGSARVCGALLSQSWCRPEAGPTRQSFTPASHRPWWALGDQVASVWPGAVLQGRGSRGQQPAWTAARGR